MVVPNIWLYLGTEFRVLESTASNGGAKPTGWSHEKLFVDCMEHCTTCDRPSKEETILLILNNHESHL